MGQCDMNLLSLQTVVSLEICCIFFLKKTSIVNLSARLMVAAQKQRKLQQPILVDSATYLHSRKDVIYETLDPIFVKGKAQRILIYTPLNPLEVCLLKPPKKERKVCFGREEILDNLISLVEGLGRSNSIISCALIGHAGSGKSTLLEKLAEVTIFFFSFFVC